MKGSVLFVSTPFSTDFIGKLNKKLVILDAIDNRLKHQYMWSRSLFNKQRESLQTTPNDIKKATKEKFIWENRVGKVVSIIQKKLNNQ